MRATDTAAAAASAALPDRLQPSLTARPPALARSNDNVTALVVGL